VATVKQVTGSEYQVAMTATELAMVKNVLDGAERLSRFGIEVLADVDDSRDDDPSKDSRLWREIEILAMREASLRSLRKTLADVDRGDKLAPVQRADLDQLRSGAALPVPRPRSWAAPASGDFGHDQRHLPGL
jgi:hypothetical protein